MDTFGRFYEVHALRGASSVAAESVDHPLEIADEIRKLYTYVAQAGGRIVGTHTLKCEMSPLQVSTPPDADGRVGQADYLFIVAEMPVDRDEPG